jgi:type I restriction enzyme R subunit
MQNIRRRITKKKLSKEQLAELSIHIEEIVSKYTKVDWHENTDVHNRIDQEVEDLLFDFAETNNIVIGLKLIDKILKEVRAVALRRY